MMSRAVIALAFVVFGVSPGFAQSLQSFAAVPQRVKAGDRVRIVTGAGTSTTGQVTRVTASDISIDANHRETTFTSGDVREIALRHRSTLFGAVAGAAAGAVAFGIPECNGDPHDQCGEGIGMGAFFGGGIGAIVGAFIPRSIVVYRVDDRRVHISPALGPHTVGVVARLW